MVSRKKPFYKQFINRKKHYILNNSAYSYQYFFY